MISNVKNQEKTEDLFKLALFNSREDTPIKEKDKESNQDNFDNKETTTLEILFQMEKTKGEFKFY